MKSVKTLVRNAEEGSSVTAAESPTRATTCFSRGKPTA
jgi:hypothetical protein